MPDVSSVLVSALPEVARVCAEFHRITNVNLLNQFYAELDRHTPQLFALYRQKASRTGKISEVLRDILRSYDLQVEKLGDPDITDTPVAFVMMVTEDEFVMSDIPRFFEWRRVPAAPCSHPPAPWGVPDPSETDIVATEPSFVGGRRSVRVLGGGRRSALQLGGGRRLALLLGCGRHSALRLGCGRREDSFELHSVDLELEAVEKQIRDLQVKQAQLRQRKAALELSRTDAHLSQVNSRRETITPTTSTPCASLPRPSARMRPTQVSFTPAPGYHAAWMQQQRKTRAKPRARTSPPPPPPVFEIPTQNRFAPLRETACDAVIIGDSIVRHVRATAAKGKVHTRCLPGARVLDVSAQVPAILKKNIGAVVLHAGTNDIRLRQTEILKKDFRSLVEKVRTTSPTTRIIVSGPLPTFQRGIESQEHT
ncbi:hypothetical protein QTP70_000323 [Hemibagrus guttatus]|uniref:SGNH hydrolase-type esterase domain-containing protein n=1 Tax=Hemibagrus guttatus TaxID=175788 RepID=A0AAE0Q8X0_9TELE|nr:hypothetical protein QTP70_000323 [Hemibagrus guttatus]